MVKQKEEFISCFMVFENSSFVPSFIEQLGFKSNLEKLHIATTHGHKIIKHRHNKL